MYNCNVFVNHTICISCLVALLNCKTIKIFVFAYLFQICPSQYHEVAFFVGCSTYPVLPILKLHLQDFVIFLGVKSNVNEYMQAMDVFLFPSLYEGLGIVAIEAQVSKLPVFISDAVPDEVMISDNIYRVNLTDNDDVWSDKVLNNTIDRAMVQIDSIKCKEYTIAYASKTLEKKYREI